MKKFLRNILYWISLLMVVALVLSYLSNYISPARIWQLAIMGLIYPYLLIINVLFCFLWLWRKKWFALVPIIVILGGTSNIGRYFQIRLKPTVGPKMGIKLISYNVRVFNQYKWVAENSARDSILKFINQQKPDIVCFQEFYTHTKAAKLKEAYIDAALKDFPYKRIFYSLKNYDSRYGVATYSKYPIIGGGESSFENTFNSFMYSDIRVKGDTIRLFNVHLQSVKLGKMEFNLMDSLILDFKSKRIDEVKNLSGLLKDAYIKRAKQVDMLNKSIVSSKYPVIVCGDFNDTPVSYTYHQVRGKLSDAFISSGRGVGNTYRGNFPSYRIDFIFHDPMFKSWDFRTININSSDHFPVSCTLNWQRKSTK